MSQLFSLEGKVALVTGGAGEGYGAQAVRALCRCGATVVCTSRSPQRAAKAVERYAAQGFSVTGDTMDPVDEASVQRVVRDVVARHGRLDILVNNAAANHLEPLETVDAADFTRVLEVNVTGTMVVTRAAVAAMRTTPGDKSVIMVSSIYGMVAPDPRIYGDSGLNSPLAYGASKAALLQMTRYLAVHYAPDVRVNAVTPGGLYAGQDSAFVAAYCHRTPLQRMAGPKDLEGAVAFLASDAAAWVTGHNLVVDGGWSAW